MGRGSGRKGPGGRVLKNRRLFKNRLIVVSNREPYSLKKGRSEKSVGGLVSALDPVMRASKGVWVASTPAGRGVKDRRIMVPLDDPSYTMRLVPVTRRDMDDYYHGYSNRLLWPLCHITLDKIFLKQSYWEGYKKVNSLFADAVVEEAQRKGVFVWLQDYHLALCARYVRERRPDLKLSLFWHIPWPPYDVFRACPQKREILEGMLANDLIGFQIESFKRNFMRCVDMELGAGIDVKEGFIHWRGHSTRVRAFPISVDYEWFENAARSKRAERFARRFMRERNLSGRIMGLSVDRLDYTKGIIKCIEALDAFFEKYPEYRERFTFVQVAVPTRKAEPYLSYMEQVRSKVRYLNEKYSTRGWRPVEYMEKRLGHEDLAALYRAADIVVITSVYDGMNLVAKEYVASQVDLKGILLVSEFAGAAEDVPGSIHINPYDTEGCADVIRNAIETEPETKRDLLKVAREYIKEYDIYRWVEGILEEMKEIR